MFSFLKMIWLCFWAIVATGILFFPITIAALFSRTGNLAFNLSKIWAWFMLKVTMVRPHIVGREKIQKNRSYVIISKHLDTSNYSQEKIDDLIQKTRNAILAHL